MRTESIVAVSLGLLIATAVGPRPGNDTALSPPNAPSVPRIINIAAAFDMFNQEHWVYRLDSDGTIYRAKLADGFPCPFPDGPDDQWCMWELVNPLSEQ